MQNALTRALSVRDIADLSAIPLVLPEPGDDLPAWTCRVHFNDGTSELVRVR